jgi:hypothetical protein
VHLHRMRDAAKALIPLIMERPAPVRIRRAGAMDRLIRVLAEAALNDLLRLFRATLLAHDPRVAVRLDAGRNFIQSCWVMPGPDTKRIRAEPRVAGQPDGSGGLYLRSGLKRCLVSTTYKDACVGNLLSA